METEELMKLGLSKTEAVLYLKLLKIGACDVQTLIKGLPKNKLTN